MSKVGVYRGIVNDNTLACYDISEQLSNHYNLDNFVSICIMFTCDSYGERGGEKKTICRYMAELNTNGSKII